MSLRLLHVFFDSDMRCQHDGLAKRAKDERKFNVQGMKPGDLLVFINARRNMIKVLAGLDEAETYGILGCYKSPHGRRIAEEAIQYIPVAFGSDGLNYSKALKLSLEKKLGELIPK